MATKPLVGFDGMVVVNNIFPLTLPTAVVFCKRRKNPLDYKTNVANTVLYVARMINPSEMEYENIYTKHFLLFLKFRLRWSYG